MSKDTTKQTEATLTHHLQAFAEGDINAILADYVEESILYTKDGPLRGLLAERAVATRFSAKP